MSSLSVEFLNAQKSFCRWVTMKLPLTISLSHFPLEFLNFSFIQSLRFREAIVSIIPAYPLVTVPQWELVAVILYHGTVPCPSVLGSGVGKLPDEANVYGGVAGPTYLQLFWMKCLFYPFHRANCCLGFFSNLCFPVSFFFFNSCSWSAFSPNPRGLFNLFLSTLTPSWPFCLSPICSPSSKFYLE